MYLSSEVVSMHSKCSSTRSLLTSQEVQHGQSMPWQKQSVTNSARVSFIVRSHTSVGTFPANLFFSKRMPFNIRSAPILDGMVPERLLLWRSKIVRFLRSPNESGSVPFTAVPYIFKEVKLVANPISLGIVPSN